MFLRIVLNCVLNNEKMFNDGKIEKYDSILVSKSTVAIQTKIII